MEKAVLLKRMEVLADGTRLQIVSLLAKEGELCACKLLERLSITQGTLSHHMKALAATQFVTCRREGKWCHYALNAKTMKALVTYFEQLTTPATGSCCHHDGK